LAAGAQAALVAVPLLVVAGLAPQKPLVGLVVGPPPVGSAQASVLSLARVALVAVVGWQTDLAAAGCRPRVGVGSEAAAG
jgi:hypothetical protein